MFTAFLVAWQVYVDTSGISDLVLPPPTKIVLALRDGIASGLLPRHFLVTFTEVLLGFAGALIAALVLGTLISQFLLIEAALFPFVVALQTIPKIALAPLLLIWVGFGLEGKISDRCSQCFFPVGR